MPTTPLLLYDNLFDTAVSYPGATIDANSEPSGSEAFRVGDSRRDRTFWQPASDGGGTDQWVRVDLGSSMTRAVDYLAIDRGSNLWGKTIYLEGSADGATWTLSQAITVPASGTVGGVPTMSGASVTEEGVVWALRGAAFAARRWWRVRVPYTAAFIPVITGLMAGSRTQLLGYASAFDEDAAERTQSSQVSTAGWRGSDRVYSWRTTSLPLTTIGATEYDATVRALQAAMFDRGIPAMLFMDYATSPERGWLYEYDGARWTAPKTRVHRSVTIPLREVGPRVR